MSDRTYRVVDYIMRAGKEPVFGLMPGWCIMSFGGEASALAVMRARESGRIHRLKCWPAYFDAIKRGDKKFELRIDDREPRFEAGDVLEIERFVPAPVEAA